MEGDLKSAQSTIEEVERVKADLEEVVKRQASDISALSGRVEEELASGQLLAKKAKEAQQRVAEAEEEGESERQAKLRAEKQRSELARELAEMNERLEEAGGATVVQVRDT